MRNNITKLLLLGQMICLSALGHAQPMELSEGWKFHTGDDLLWNQPRLDDSAWEAIDPGVIWEYQGHNHYDGYAWYRLRFFLPDSLLKNASMGKDILFNMGKIDDVDETYLNGERIGGMGSFPGSADGCRSSWPDERRYVLPVTHPALKWGGENVLTIRVYDGDGNGGMFGDKPYLKMLEVLDYVTIDINSGPFQFDSSKVKKTVWLRNTSDLRIEGTLKTVPLFQGKAGMNFGIPVVLEPHASSESSWYFPKLEGAEILYTFTENTYGQKISVRQEMPYILTPAESPEPKINMPSVYGCRPKAPVLLLIAASGERPLAFEAKGLPRGLKIDKKTGIITGNVDNKGTYPIELKATNTKGSNSKTLTLEVGDQICLTPPMGWNSWNCWGLSVSDARVRASAEGMQRSGLIQHGWTYINIDDGWEAAERAPDGSIVTNEKFPDMPALTNYLHNMGLKAGIYSSPGPLTCGGFLGSWQHEQQDASTYAAWGIDYLKYDWCSYFNIAPKNPGLEDLKKPYMLMDTALRNTGRDIVYSLCQYGMGKVWEWGGKVGGNLWRTTGDIEDSWESLRAIGFSQGEPAYFSKTKYGWGDPDMLIVGKLGWGDQLHASRLTPSEQYTHISLWCLLNAPLLIGCDLSDVDAFTYNLLTNDEVIAVDQDVVWRRVIAD
ncbi:MAG: putative Ig domain-containing protein [Lewinellaceae bacterium]|nr:putative Ig domain-containing protein [Lewinellaceae bacterium]